MTNLYDTAYAESINDPDGFWAKAMFPIQMG